MTENQSAHQSIPLLRNNEEQLAKTRRQLERMFRELRLVQDVIMVCGDVRECTGSDLDDEVEHVLRRCGSDRLFNVLKVLTEIVAFTRSGDRDDCVMRGGGTPARCRVCGRLRSQ